MRTKRAAPLQAQEASVPCRQARPDGAVENTVSVTFKGTYLNHRGDPHHPVQANRLRARTVCSSLELFASAHGSPGSPGSGPSPGRLLCAETRTEVLGSQSQSCFRHT